MDNYILKYKKDFIDIALSFVDPGINVEDIVLCGSRAGDWYLDNSDVDLAVGIEGHFDYDPEQHWFNTTFKDYSVDVFIVPTDMLGKWRGLQSPYYSLYDNKYFEGREEDLNWLRTHKPLLRARRNHG